MPNINEERGDRIMPISGPDNMLSASVYRNAERGYGDGTNGGVSSRFGRVYIVNEGHTAPMVKSGDEEYPALYIVYNERRDTFRAVPVGLEGTWTMAGGNFVWCCDSRFREVSEYPVPIHDRVEGR